MNFEDIVDMDWVETHTTSDFSSEYFFDHQPDFLLEQPLTPPNMSAHTIEPEIKMEPIASMPTTEQIKQLIEIAKRQLALREQQHQPALFQPIIDTSITNINAAVNETSTAAPSTLFSMPPIPVLSPTTVATSEITAIENATTLETISKQMNSITSPSSPPMTTTTSSSTTTTTNNNNVGGRRDSLASMPDESISLEAYAEQDGIDLKRLTPKERRQLRNKLSARNFRVRRKEYISTLEGQVNDHKMAAEALKDKLVKVEEENKKLRKEMDTLKRQNQILQQQQQQQQQKTSPRILSSPLPKPNLNKDISIMGTKATDSYRQQDNCILVSNAIMPAWDYQAILCPKTNKMNLLVGQFLLSVVQLASTMPRGTNHIQDLVDYTLPLMPDDRDFSSSSTTIKSSISNNFASSTPSSSSYITPSSPSSPSSSNYSPPSPYSSSYMEDLYDVLIQSALINSSTTDKSFWWWDNNNTSFTM
ncbi:hypothetical protein MFLAVUS_001428 [Mucor flavus]|uniref:BZIP domain-containing protein n=1 Tax=Mucor flavus TaxID=439312 RepID=A0ABP9YMG6_9FUNG